MLRIPAKRLGEPAAPDFCPLCFWRKLRLRFRLPYQFVPGVFSALDSIEKESVRQYFDEYARLPPWMAAVGDAVRFVEPPHWSAFHTLIAERGILLTGMADGIFALRDGSYAIADYKTARLTPAQDKLLPVYAVQLNAYARIARDRGIWPVSRLALVYFEPARSGVDHACLGDGLRLKLNTHVVQVERQPELVDRMCAAVRMLHALARPPTGRPGCRDCATVQGLTGPGRPQRWASSRF